MDELQNANDGLEVIEDINDTDVQGQPDEQKVKQLEAQKRHWRDKAIDPKTGKTYKALLEEAMAKPKETPVDTSNFASKDEVTDIKLGQMGFDVDTAKYVKTYAKGAGKTPFEVLEDEPIKLYLQAKRQDEALKNAQPAPSNRTIVIGDKTLTQMSKAERQANWQKIVEAAKKK